MLTLPSGARMFMATGPVRKFVDEGFSLKMGSEQTQEHPWKPKPSTT